jgi:hypothetical protein
MTPIDLKLYNWALGYLVQPRPIDFVMITRWRRLIIFNSQKYI